MSSLETKVPPPIVAISVGIAMWGTYKLAPLIQLPSAVRVGGVSVMVVLGVIFSIAGILAFKRAQTTVNPTTPEKASSLVNSGIYRITRNPMYVGLSCLLVAYAVYLSSAWALLGPLAFVLYIGRFQIAPEERALLALFGSQYADYQSRVRRWL